MPMLDSVVWKRKCSKEEEIIYLQQITDFWYIWMATLLNQCQVIIFWLLIFIFINIFYIIIFLFIV